MHDDKASILFLCTGNSARSIMAEAIANQRFGEHLRGASAGSRPTGRVHPLALATLAGNGLATDGLRSKSRHELTGETFDLVLTLCDAAAAQPCPTFPGDPPAAHWSLPDPPAAADPEPTFQAVFDVLEEAIGVLVAGPGVTLPDRAADGAALIRQRFQPLHR